MLIVFYKVHMVVCELGVATRGHVVKDPQRLLVPEPREVRARAAGDVVHRRVPRHAAAQHQGEAPNGTAVLATHAVEDKNRARHPNLAPQDCSGRMLPHQQVPWESRNT